MKKKLQQIKEESQQICTEISSTLNAQAKELGAIAAGQFKNLDEFDAWFNSGAPLVL